MSQEAIIELLQMAPCKLWQAWDESLLNMSDFDPMAIDAQPYTEQLQQLSAVLFSPRIDVEVIESSAPSDTVRLSALQDEASMKSLLSRTVVPQLRIISITQDNSVSPFNIDEDSMCEVLKRHQVPSGFLDVICRFGDRQVFSDEGVGSVICNNPNSSCRDIFYQLRYAERNGRKHGDPWSLRQTGVYHRYSMPAVGVGQNFCLLLHPMQNSKAQKRISMAASTGMTSRTIGLDPVRLHVLIMSSYVNNWCWYLRYNTKNYLELEDMLMTSDLRDREDYLGMNFNTLQALRHLAAKLIPIPAILRNTISIITALQTMNNSLPGPHDEQRVAETAYQLKACSSRLEGYISATDVLQQRIENMTKFLADGLNLQNQDISAEINNHLLTLTKDTVDDSATVRIITLVTLTYLPASFITGLFGMNFFSFNSNTRTLLISKSFWICVAVTIPLTFLTLGYWKYGSWHQKKQRLKDFAALRTA